jgi:tRNA 2-selenouridine synthase
MKNNLITCDQFRDLFKGNVPFLDVRAKMEFDKGHFPTSHNLPILNDEERQAVGVCFKEMGKDEAIKLGHSLVKGEIKDKRIKEWCEFVNKSKNAHLYCWRGGMRSNYASRWMNDYGVQIPIIDGGFKALRRVLIDEIEDTALQVPMMLIGGKTGTSKTVLVNSIEFSSDLEGHANHRGSSFGRRVSGVKTQIDFENSLGIDLIKKRDLFPNRILFLEDESRRIGNCIIPDNFLQKMHSSPIGIIEMSMEQRIQHIEKEYVVEMFEEFLEVYPDDGWERFVDYLTQSLTRVQKRLGPERYSKIRLLMDKALENQNIDSGTNQHEGWIQSILSEYYDPMYEFQLSKKKELITFKGSYNDVLEWAVDKSKSSK